MKLPLIRKPIKAEPDIPDVIALPEENTSHGLKHFSYSQLSTYLRCSYQYYFKYILGIKEAPSLALATGKGGHAALEWNARRKLSTGEDMPTPDMLDLASDFLDIGYSEIEKLDAKESGRAKDQTIGQVRVYRTKQAPAIEPIAVEHKFELIIPPDNDYPDPILPTIGYTDVIAMVPRPATHPGRSSMALSIEDYKFTGRAKSQGEIDITPQLSIYDLNLYEQTGTLPDVLGIRMFTYTKDGPQVRVAYRSKDLMKPSVRKTRWERLRQQIRRVQAAINAGVFIPTDDPKTCAWCPYAYRCQYNLIKTR